MTQVLTSGGRPLHYVDLADAAHALGRDLLAQPYVIRILLENLYRHQKWGDAISDAEIARLWDWRDHVGADLALHVARVILPDSSGLPVLQDLAALRDAVAQGGSDAARVDTRIPVDLIVDHSLQVDHWGDSQAVSLNLRREFERNDERYRFLKWAQQAFRGLRVIPPGMGIIHQINLEYLAPIVATRERDDGCWVYPDFVIGGDSHTPMVNALGVLGWGVGGIDAEAALLGQAYTFPVPEVIGVRLKGSIRPPALTTDAALLITQRLRAAGVTGRMVEFFGPAVAHLSIPERATIANMAPEYGATCGFFPIDAQSLDYARMTGRPQAQVQLIEDYAKANHLWRDDGTAVPQYTRILEIDLSEAVPSMAGPRRPQDRMPWSEVPEDFHRRLTLPLNEGGFGVDAAPTTGQALTHGSIVLAAITSCTNTSNPAVMLAAGLVAKKALALGLTPPAWLKRSLAPGSRAVTRYLQDAGLLEALQAQGFEVIGYGCTTCGGKSGPLTAQATEAISQQGLVTAAVLSGNRNFEGRIHKLVRANYIGSPAMVVLFALAGRIDIDFEREPLGAAQDGRPVYLADVWPTPQEIQALLPCAANPDIFAQVYAPESLDSAIWRELQAPGGLHFPWDPASLYLVEPPFFKDGPDHPLQDLARSLQNARVLAVFGDSLTTDHISPSGEIPADTPAGRYLSDAGLTPRDFNTYVARRCNHHVMTRATFGNIRIKNELVPGTEGGFTRHYPEGTPATIFDAAQHYRRQGTAAIVLGAKDYGMGSSRDWAAKGSALLGVRAVIAESFERIHRANLVGMGVLPLDFEPTEGWRELGLQGSEQFALHNIEAGIMHGEPIEVIAQAPDGQVTRFTVRAQVLTEAERQLMAAGGIPASVLHSFLNEPAANPA
ncbi:aconitate hydratase AcnA [Bordetella holmesii]|uniref:Aconitate hydratase n=1 Tax=Bordetella holmesii CDC-H585-BH TaxID=1331206 RepID=A0A158M1D5_9BORD|nr:aconitate hydratase AcnA [Bordetella holmesii]AMD44211.1 aconitate hydratase [Bordetella holmesii H558]AMD50256.1 aconitate hydratase [Bordetella holmesii F627]AOB36320.1 aconitate hydratase 1 [Bordetella holmesii]AUL20290.1 aconitate hydratase 1 [Bordetella holmesii]AUL23614.1 aconitate hydratase 1 [Bordetella holmesii]